MKHRLIPQAVTVWSAKGGVAKTTSEANLAVHCAREGWRTLIVDADPGQGNMARTLGYVGDERWDGGRQFADAVLTRGRTPLPIMHDVRPGLDVAAGGPEARHLATTLAALAATDPAVAGVMGELLAPLAGDYDIIFIDLPPTVSALHQACFTAAHYLVLAAQPSPLALDGLGPAIEAWAAVRAGTNPDFSILGAIITGHDARNTIDLNRCRTRLTHLLRDVPVIGPPVRASAAADNHMKDLGLVAVEMAETAFAAKRARITWLKSRDGNAPRGVSPVVSQIAADYAAVAREFCSRFSEAQAQWMSSGATATGGDKR